MNPIPNSEDELVRLLIARRRDILAYIQSIVFDRNLAEDIYQNVAVVVLRKKDQVIDPDDDREIDTSRLLGWVLGVARLESFSALRKRRGSPMVLSDQVLGLLDATWKAELEKKAESESEVREALQLCMKRLNSRAQKILELRYTGGLSGQSLATEIGSELNTAYVTLSRIHKRLRSCISDRLSRASS